MKPESRKASRGGAAATRAKQGTQLEPPLLGLGPVSLRVLRKAGINTRADLERMGPVRAYMAAKRVERRVTLNLLWGIAGALTNTHWTRLPEEYRSSLLLEYDGLVDAERIVVRAKLDR
jgi:TfoX C-terminal domain